MFEEKLVELWPSALALIAAGGIAGFLAGLLGVGGGIVIVPVLYNLLPLMQVPEESRMHIAVATSLATIIATSISSVRAHHQRGGIDMALVKRIAPYIFTGAVLGAALGGKISSDFMAGLFAVIALLVAIKVAFGSDSQVITSSFPTGLGGGAIGLSVGSVSVLMGIGGGTLGVPILTSCNVPIRRAVGTASTFGFLIAIPGVIGFILSGWNTPNLPYGNIGYVNLIGVALIIPMTTFIAPFGAKFAHIIKPSLLRYAFAGFLTLTALRMGYSLFI
jgi:uncharacterized membrane protein YfcA